MSRFNKKASRNPAKKKCRIETCSKGHRERRYINYYQCPDCNVLWEDIWTSMCNDRCPDCNKEIEPYRSRDLPQPYDISTPPCAKASHYVHIKSPTGKVHAVNCTESRFGSYPERYITVCGTANYQSGEGMWRKWPITDAPVTCKHCIKQMGTYPYKEVIAHQILNESGYPASNEFNDTCTFTDLEDAEIYREYVKGITGKKFRMRRVKIIYLED